MKIVNGVLVYADEGDFISGELCVPKGVQSISEVASGKLKRCEGFKALSFEEGSQFAGFCDGQFGESVSLSTVDLTNCEKLKEIPLGCFCNCANLGEVKLPNGI